ncbi:HAD family phosphatase [Synechococcus sp. M16CYN]|uniref:HAD family hydrolase n=1 Tax=Synechococcus sp. M16CYN TaxID=3103139 RepID=UPI00324641D3
MTQLPTACLFDLDGLLLDTESIHSTGWSKAAAHFGTELNEAQLLKLKGRRRIDCAGQVDSWLPTPVGIDALLAVQQPIVRVLLPEASAMPMAEDLVRHCCDHNIKTALVTSSSREAVNFKTAHHPWIEFIQERIYGDDPNLMAGKPDPSPYLLAAQRLKVEPSNCWALEDSAAGTASALAAGCRVWVLSPERNKNRLPLSNNPCRVQSLKIVLNQLLSISG